MVPFLHLQVMVVAPRYTNYEAAFDTKVRCLVSGLATTIRGVHSVHILCLMRCLS